MKTVISLSAAFIAAYCSGASAFSPSGRHPVNKSRSLVSHQKLSASSSSSSSQTTIQEHISAVATTLLSITLLTTPILTPQIVHAAEDRGASVAANSKITTGGASTLQSGRTIAITRGVNLDNSNFKGQNLKGVAFQQSIVRDSDFRGANLVGASFFDATIDGSDFEDADMSLCNLEMAQRELLFALFCFVIFFSLCITISTTSSNDNNVSHKLQSTVPT